MRFWNKANRKRPENVSVMAEGPTIAQHFKLGQRGESLAIEYLEHAGYRIVASNISLPIGRNTRDVIVNAEIDVASVAANRKRDVGRYNSIPRVLKILD